MTKAEIIQITLSALREGDVLWSGTPDAESSDTREDYEASVVIPALMERLPDNEEIKTCADFPDIGVTCCSICHSFYPHYDMYLEDMPDGSKAWVCCFVRSALHGEDPAQRSEELIDLETALGGRLDGPDDN